MEAALQDKPDALWIQCGSILNSHKR